ncbi:MAG TPA: vWA domain-containing protein [Candidatus Sumerlaeota bacterium]|nr:vWA domain-containing protein [Candidatus Sumerlaeota bacterium]
MTRNPFVGRRCFSRHITERMRDLNRVERAMGCVGNTLDVMIIVDTSGSMGTVIDTVRSQVGRIFSGVIETYGGTRIGLMQQGVDGSTNEPTYAGRALILCQPTRDPAVFSAATRRLPSAGGGYEWYLNAMELAADQTEWASGAQKMLITIGDEQANQYHIGYSYTLVMSRLYETVAYLKARGVISSMICPRASSWAACQVSYENMATGTGGQCLVAPTDSEVVEMIVTMIGYFQLQQTRWTRYEMDGSKTSLGEPDGGVGVPALEALEDAPLTPLYIRDLRAAVERIVAQKRLKTPRGVLYDWTPGSPGHLLARAMESGADYGRTGTPDTWRRSVEAMIGTAPRDLDIGEIYECVRLLKAAAGVTE